MRYRGKIQAGKVGSIMSEDQETKLSQLVAWRMCREFTFRFSISFVPPSLDSILVQPLYSPLGFLSDEKRVGR